MKTCDVHGCTFPVFGTDKNTKKRYCKKHQFLRTDTIKKIRKKRVKERNEALAHNKLDFDVFQWGFEDEATMFDWVWEDRQHVSQVSGILLDDVTLYHAMFAHILPKGKFPLYRYNPNNILLVHPLEHVLIDQGSSSARKNYVRENPTADFNVFYNKKELLLSQYPNREKSYGQEAIAI